MIVVKYVEFYKVIVIKPDIFGSEIVDERHFRTKEEAAQFQMDVVLNHNDLICVSCQIWKLNRDWEKNLAGCSSLARLFCCVRVRLCGRKLDTPKWHAPGINYGFFSTDKILKLWIKKFIKSTLITMEIFYLTKLKYGYIIYTGACLLDFLTIVNSSTPSTLKLKVNNPLSAVINSVVYIHLPSE